MNIGLYQSASALSALERWQECVAQNITASQTTGYRKRTVSFSSDTAGELNPASRGAGRSSPGVAALFPKSSSGINFVTGETLPTRREFDVAIQGEGFFTLQRPDGSRVYTRSGEFRLRPDRTLVTSGDDEVLAEGGAPVTLLPGGGVLTINRDGTIFQGGVALGRLAVVKFRDPSILTPMAGGCFVAPAGTAGEPVGQPDLLQGYLEASNVTPLREMVDLVLISRAYEANQKIVTAADQQMQKTFDALG